MTHNMTSSRQLAAKRRKEFEAKIRQERERGNPVELIARVKPHTKFAAEKALGRIGEVRHVFELLDYIAFSCNPDVAHAFFKKFHRESSQTRYAQLFSNITNADITGTLSTTPQGTYRKTEKPQKRPRPRWNLERIGAYKARDYANGDVGVAVIDTGAEYYHPEISHCFGECLGYDFVKNTDTPLDLNGHGTHVAGTIAGEYYGASPNSRLYALRVLDENGSGSEADLIRAIEWCCKNKDVSVVNMSLGSNTASQALEEACSYARNLNIILIAAAGNDSGAEPDYPAAFSTVIAVGAADRNDSHADFSNLNPDITAPGVDITSAYINGSYATASGTSMAAPHVTGTIALAYSMPTNADPEEALLETAEKIGATEEFGAGMARADKLTERLSRKSLYEIVKEAIW